MPSTNKPVVGGPATVSIGSDSYAATVLSVSKSGRKVVVQEDTSTVLSGSAADGSARYGYTENKQGCRWTCAKTMRRGYQVAGSPSFHVSFGWRRTYSDPSF